jgi:hypothetical protein
MASSARFRKHYKPGKVIKEKAGPNAARLE